MPSATTAKKFIRQFDPFFVWIAAILATLALLGPSPEWGTTSLPALCIAPLVLCIRHGAHLGWIVLAIVIAVTGVIIATMLWSWTVLILLVLAIIYAIVA